MAKSTDFSRILSWQDDGDDDTIESDGLDVWMKKVPLSIHSVLSLACVGSVDGGDQDTEHGAVMTRASCI